MRHTRILPRTILFATIMATLSAGSALWAQEERAAPWTTVGSAGTVDEADLLTVLLGSPVPGAVALRPGFGIRPVGVRIRYNVVAVDGVLGASGLALTSRFLDRGFGERVLVEFKEYGLQTGLTTTLLTLDSNAFAGSPAFQVQAVSTPVGPDCAPLFPPLNFAENAYFMDVLLSRSFLDRPPIDPPVVLFSTPEPANSIGPALGIIKLGNPECLL